MGIPWLELIDFDIVEPSNLASQGYLEQNLGRYKVEATAALCRATSRATQVQAFVSRFRRSIQIGNCVLCCVDSIDARRRIWQAVGLGAFEPRGEPSARSASNRAPDIRLRRTAAHRA